MMKPKIKIINAEDYLEVIAAAKVANSFIESAFEGYGREHWKMFVTDTNPKSPFYAAWWVNETNITVRVCYPED